jgi:predicted metal-dependent phosphoesterase TrpH
VYHLHHLERLGRADLHMHTRASDGLYSVQQVLDHVARRHTLDVIAITDHDVLDASLWAYEHRDRYPFEIVPGLEVTSAEGHVLALWCMQPIPKHLSLSETAAAIHEQGGLAVLAHPGEVLIGGSTVMKHLRRPSLITEAGIDAIEVYNAGTLTPGSNRLARRMADRLPLPRLANSDAHTLNGIGRAMTRFEGRTAQDLLQAILTQQTWVEGRSWSFMDYLQVSPTSIRWTVDKLLAKRRQARPA